VTFEVDRTCTGASPERTLDGKTTGRLVRSFSDLAALLRLATRYEWVRLLPPAEPTGRHHRLHFGRDGDGRPKHVEFAASWTRIASFGLIPGSDWERFASKDLLAERRYVDVTDLDELIELVDACEGLELRFQREERHPFRVTMLRRVR
jgi:hypothetical protein